MPAKIHLVKGDITEMAVDAIVSAANTDLDFAAGLASAVRRKGGERIEEECERLAPLRLGAATVTTAGNLKSLFVIHAASTRPGEKATTESIRLATHESLLRAEEKAIKSLALPALGTGQGGFKAGECAPIMLGVVLDHIKMRSSLEKIYFVLHDEAALRAFEEAFAKLTARPPAGAAEPKL